MVRGVQRARRGQALAKHLVIFPRGQGVDDEGAFHHIGGGLRRPSSRADMILNEPTYRLFRPDLANPTRADFEVAARTLNKLPVAALEPADISNAILYLVSDAGRYVTGITHVVDAGGQLG
jgi:hypothetical protein